MSKLAPSADVPTALGQPPRELWLRIRGSARDGQLVRLAGDKCSIGSAESCTLRLVLQGIQPVHCLILRGPRGAVVRRWSADTRLNGQEFDDAPLVVGDRLGVGPLEFELVSDQPVATQVEVRGDSPSTTSADDGRRAELDRMEEQHARLAADETRLADERNVLAAERALLADERRALADLAWRQQTERAVAADVAAAAAELRAQFAGDAEQLAEQRAQLDAEWSRLRAERHSLARHHESWHRERLVSEQGLTAAAALNEQKTAELADLSAALRLRSDELAQAEAALQSRETTLAATLLDARNAQAEAQRERKSVDDERRALALSTHELARQRKVLADAEAAADARRARIEADEQRFRESQEQLEDERQRLASERDGLGEEHRRHVAEHAQTMARIEDQARGLAASENHLAATRLDLETREERLFVAFDRLDAERQALAQVQQRSAEERACLAAAVRRHAAERDLLSTVAADVGTLRAEVARERQRIEADRSAVEVQWRRLAEEQALLDQRRDEWEKRRKETEFELAIEAQHLARRVSEIDGRSRTSSDETLSLPAADQTVTETSKDSSGVADRRP